MERDGDDPNEALRQANSEEAERLFAGETIDYASPLK